MAVTWGSTFKENPAGSDSPSEGDDKIRQTREAIQERVTNEHYTVDDTESDGSVSKDWLHKKGSARPFYQASAPTALANGTALTANTEASNGRLWIDSDNDKLYVYDAAADNWNKVDKPQVTRITIQGPLATGTDILPPIVAPTGITITGIYARVKIAPTGAGIRLGFNKNGSDDILGTATYVEIAAGAYSGNETSDFDGSNAVLAAGDYLTVDIDQVGSTVKGSDLSISIVGSL
jgi:hypothetical protein